MMTPDQISSIDLSTNPGSSPQRVRSVVVVGAGGHGRELADIVRQISQTDTAISLLGIVDDGNPDRLALARGGFRFLGSSGSLDGRDVDVYIGIGSPLVRQEIDERLTRTGPALRHPSALVGTGVVLDSGAVLAQGVVLTTNIEVGRHAHVNVGATISHDCRVGSYSTICPGVTLTGAVTIGERVFVGAGATVLPGVSVGAGAIIGAGATVTQDVAPQTTVVGTPARAL